MYIYQNGKLYVKEGNKLIGVEIHPNSVIKVEGTETKLADSYEILTPHEVQCRFHIIYGKSYIFPVEKKVEKKVVEKVEVVKNEPVAKVKSTTRKSTRK